MAITEKIDNLFNSLKEEFDNSLFKVVSKIQKLVKIKNEGGFYEKIKWPIIFNEAKEEILHLRFSREIENDFLLNYINRKISDFENNEAFKECKNVPMMKLHQEGLADLLLVWHEFKEWYQIEILNENINLESTIDLNLPEIELKTQKEQIRLLYELGVIEFLQKKYPATLKGNNNQIAHLIAQILKFEKTSIQPTVNALLNDNATNKNYPKDSVKTKAIIDKLNLNESI
jgi:hypothetical protein